MPPSESSVMSHHTCRVLGSRSRRARIAAARAWPDTSVDIFISPVILGPSVAASTGLLSGKHALFSFIVVGGMGGYCPRPAAGKHFSAPARCRAKCRGVGSGREVLKIMHVISI